jgi:uncharacterized LabA/DUF88 family protein
MAKAQSEPSIRREKVCLFVDNCDLYTALQPHGDVRLDYKRLMDWLVRQRELCVARYYTGEIQQEDSQRREKFYSVLERVGYEVVVSTNPHSEEKCGALDEKVRAACHCAMVWDICSFTLNGRYDTIILVTGAPEFSQVVTWAKRRGVDVEVAFFPHVCDEKLRANATRYVEMHLDSIRLTKGREAEQPPDTARNRRFA